MFKVEGIKNTGKHKEREWKITHDSNAVIILVNVLLVIFLLIYIFFPKIAIITLLFCVTLILLNNTLSILTSRNLKLAFSKSESKKSKSVYLGMKSPVFSIVRNSQHASVAMMSRWASNLCEDSLFGKTLCRLKITDFKWTLRFTP